MDVYNERRSAAREQEGRLAASVAHEINNPLDALLNLLYLLESEPNLSDKGREYLVLAEEEVRRASQIAHEALHGFRDGARPEDTNVPRLVGSVLEFYRPRFEARGISVSSRYCSDGNLSVHAGYLRRAFSNLLLNAADAMPGGGRMNARVSKGCEWSGQKRQGLRVTFADTGSGIAAEHLVRVLEPFFTTKGARGSGLGLALVREVVQKHRGVLRIRSSTKPGRSGTIFSIFLPSRQCD